MLAQKFYCYPRRAYTEGADELSPIYSIFPKKVANIAFLGAPVPAYSRGLRWTRTTDLPLKWRVL